MASTVIPTKEKDPDEILDYVFDFAPNTNGRSGASTDYLDSGETISSHSVTVPAGATLDSSAAILTNTAVRAWISGGTPGTTYRVLCQVVTTDGRTAERSFNLRVVSQR